MTRTTPNALLATLLLATASPTLAQDVVTLHSVVVDTNDDVTVTYSKNFSTCAHLRSSDTGCTQYGPLVHTANHFCGSGSTVSVTVPLGAFNPGFGPGSTVFLVHGNNANVRSSCVTVTCDGAYGSGCAGTNGTPVLDAADACPPSPGSLDLAVSAGLPGSVAVVGLGLQQTSTPLFGCTLLVGGIGAVAFLPLDPGGAATWSLPIPPGFAGVDLTSQAFVLDAGGPQGYAATGGVLARIR